MLLGLPSEKFEEFNRGFNWFFNTDVQPRHAILLQNREIENKDPNKKTGNRLILRYRYYQLGTLLDAYSLHAQAIMQTIKNC